MDELRKARLLISQKRYDMAEEELNSLLADFPDHSLAIAYKALVKVNTQKPGEAVELARAAIGLNPTLDFAFYIAAAANMDLHDFKQAQKDIIQAIAINPNVADYHGIQANIKLINRDYQEAVDIANRGLQIQPENLLCRNILSTAQLKLGDKQGSFSTIEKALEQDPENPLTHANYGWGQLEKGSHKKAMEHFKEALARDPEDGYARAGMLEALKARFFLYRWFMKYYFWMSNLKPNVQWAVIIGFIFLQKLIRAMSRNSAEIAAILMPFSYLLLAFVVSTWIIHPVFNFFMSLNRYARYLLTKEDMNTAIVVGIAFSLFVASGIGYFATGSEAFATAAVVGLTLILPFGKIWESRKQWVRITFAAYSAIAAVVGALAVIEAMRRGIDNNYFFGYIGVIVIFTWVSNLLANR